MQMKNLKRMTGLLVVASLALAACGGSGNSPSNGSTGGSGAVGVTPAITGTPAVGGEVVFHQGADPDSFAYFWRSTAYAANVLSQVYGGGLLAIGTDFLPQPNLAAEMPEISEDSKTYTFKIREDVKFHDGTQMTAYDLEFTYGIILSDEYAGPFKGNVNQIESVVAVDEFTLAITTKDIFAPFLFTSVGIPPIPKHMWQDVAIKDMPLSDVWMKNPVGAGPFKFKEFRAGEYVLVERFDQFFRNGEEGEFGGTVGPWVERIRFKTIPDDNTAIAAVEAGEISLYQKLEGDEATRLRTTYADTMQFFEWNRLGYGYQTFNNDAFPTNIKEVRQALSHALNRESIVAALLDGQGVVPPGFVPPTHWVYDSTVKGYDYDKAKAAQLMEQAGFTKNAKGIYEKDGQEAKIRYVASSGSPLVEGIALVSQQEWNALGFDVSVDLVDFNTLMERHLKPGEYHVTFSGVNFTLDPHVSFYGFHSENIRLDDKGVAQGTNRARYTNTQVDALIEQGMKTVDQNERKAIYAEAQRLIVEDAPANWIYVNLWLDVAQKDLKGLVNLDGYGVDIGFANQWFMNEK